MVLHPKESTWYKKQDYRTAPATWRLWNPFRALQVNVIRSRATHKRIADISLVSPRWTNCGLGTNSAHFGPKSGAMFLATSTAQNCLPASLKCTLLYNCRLHWPYVFPQTSVTAPFKSAIVTSGLSLNNSTAASLYSSMQPRISSPVTPG